MTNLVLLRDALFLAGCGILGLAFVLLIWLYQRITRTRRAAQVRTGPSLTETAILFQTLRGVVDDQKMLARRFNESVDKKVALMRQVIKKLLEEHEKLTQAHEDLIRQQEEVRRELAALREEAARLKGELPGAISTPRAVVETTKTAPVRKAAPLSAIAEPIEAPASDDWLENWAGFDFVIDDKTSERIEPPEPLPQLPENPEVEREAVRALLGAGPEPVQAGAVGPSADEGPDAGNGRQRNTALRARVFAYHDAGMSVAQIARELGIGRGEVRLMISLRDQGTPES